MRGSGHITDEHVMSLYQKNSFPKAWNELKWAMSPPLFPELGSNEGPMRVR